MSDLPLVGGYDDTVEEAWLRKLRNAMSLIRISDGSIVPPPPLVNGFMLHHTVSMVSAEPYTGKTMLLLALMLTLASGKPLLGKYLPVEPKRVLFLGQDAPTWDYAGQVAKLARGLDLTSDMHLLESDLILNEGLSVTDADFKQWLKAWHAATGFEVLMFDSLINFHGVDENDNQKMRVVMDSLKWIRDRLGVAVIFSHHTSKPSVEQGDRSLNYRARGASSITGSIDFHFQLRRRAKLIELVLPKARGMDDDSEEFIEQFYMERTRNDDNRPVIRLVPDYSNAPDNAIMSFLIEPRRRPEVIVYAQAVLGLSEAKAPVWVDNQLQRLKKTGAIVRVGHGLWQQAPLGGAT